MPTTFGITDQGFTLKRFADIRADIVANLSTVQDPVTGEYLTPDLTDENDPLVQIVNAITDELSVCWEQLQGAYNQFNPLAATGVALQGLVQLNGFTAPAGMSDALLRVRQQQSTSLTSYRQVDAIYAAVINVPGVLFCRVCQNSTLTTDYRGIPGKTISAVVVGGDDQAVANAIFGKTSIGMSYYGNTSKQCLDNQGDAYTVSFERPSGIPISAVINITVLDYTRWPTNGEDLIKAALVAFSVYGLAPNIGLPPGASVINSALYTPINTVPGMEIVNVLLTRSGSPIPSNVAIYWNEFAEITSGNITVNLI